MTETTLQILVSWMPLAQAIFLIIFSYAAQIRRFLKTKSSRDVSMSSVASSIIMNVTSLTYGLFFCPEIYSISVALTLVAAIVVFGVAIYYRKHTNQTTISSTKNV